MLSPRGRADVNEPCRAGEEMVNAGSASLRLVTGRSHEQCRGAPGSSAAVPAHAPDTRCAACDAPLADGQRYCLDCGARHGPLAVPGPIGIAPAAMPRGPGARGAGGVGAWEVPEPRTMAALVLVTLAFGLFLGDAAGPHAGSAAALRGPITVLAQAPAAPAADPAPAADSAGAASDAGDAVPADAAASAASTPAPPAPTSESTDTGAGAGTGSGGTTDTTDTEPPVVPPIEHVAVIALSGQDLGSAFAEGSPAPYLRDLAAQGALLKGYWALDDGRVANGVALLSGQRPNAETRAGCPRLTPVPDGELDNDGLLAGDGCLYPPAVPTLAGQLADRGDAWRAYVGGLGGPDQLSCRAPEPGAEDPWREPRVGDPYVTASNPFVYFRSVLDASECSTQDVGLDALAADLADRTATPQLLWIAPDACHDGSDRQCPAGGGLPGAEAFLREWVPKLLDAPAIKKAGVVVVTFDTGPAERSPTEAEAPAGVEGANVGAVVLSKPWVTPGTESVTGYSHLSLLRTIEDAFGLTHLGAAGGADVATFGTDVFSAWTPAR
jgi:hypothetical protein